MKCTKTALYRSCSPCLCLAAAAPRTFSELQRSTVHISVFQNPCFESERSFLERKRFSSCHMSVISGPKHGLPSHFLSYSEWSGQGSAVRALCRCWGLSEGGGTPSPAPQQLSLRVTLGTVSSPGPPGRAQSNKIHRKSSISGLKCSSF